VHDSEFVVEGGGAVTVLAWNGFGEEGLEWRRGSVGACCGGEGGGEAGL
jgi:hypothetical protein